MTFYSAFFWFLIGTISGIAITLLFIISLIDYAVKKDMLSKTDNGILLKRQ